MSRRWLPVESLSFFALLIVGIGTGLFAPAPRLLAQGPLRTVLPSDAMLGPLGLQRAWWSQASLDPTRDRVLYFVSDEQQTIVESATGMVTAIDNATGRRRWAVQVGAFTDVRFQPVTNEHLVLVVSGRKLYALEKANGDVAWELEIPNAVSASPGMDETRAYVGSVTGTVYAYNVQFLDQRAKRPELTKDTYHVMAWQFKTGARILFPPISTGKFTLSNGIASEGVVSVASGDSSLYGLSAKDKGLHFQFETDRPISAPITQVGNLIFFGTEDRKVYCLNAITGAIKWELLTGLYVRQAVRAVGEDVFVRPEQGGLRCLDLKSGVQKWSNLRAGGFLAATPDVIYASDYLGNVLLLNRKNGRQVGGFAMHGFPNRVANDRTDRLYFASERGLVVCLRERDREFPLFHKHPEKRPVLPEMAPDEDGKKGAAKSKAPAPAPSGTKKSEDAEEGTETKPEKRAGAGAGAGAAAASPKTDENAEEPAPAAKPAKKPRKSPNKPAKPVDE